MTATAPEAAMTEFECREILEWSRHYDNQLWFVTSLLTGANALLMTIPSDKFRLPTGLLGMALAVVTVFFATSFRSLRRKLYCRLEQRGCSLRKLTVGDDKALRQWRVYVFFFGLVVLYWFWMLLESGPHYPCYLGIAVVALVVFVSLLVFLFLEGRSPSDNSSAKD
jgi:hypothetical protein